MEELIIINESEMSNKHKITESGGGTLYSVTYNGNTYVYKQLKTPDEFQINYIKYKKGYFKMSKFDNLASPLFIVKNEKDIIIGYLMKFLDNYNTLGEIIGSETNTDSQKNEINFLKIFNGVINTFISADLSGIKPCPEHHNNIMISTDKEYDVVMIDLDDVDHCAEHTSQDNIGQLSSIFMDIHPRFHNSEIFKIFFEIKSGDVKLLEKFNNIEEIKDEINNYINKREKYYIRYDEKLSKVPKETIIYKLNLLVKESHHINNQTNTDISNYNRLKKSIIDLLN